MEGGEPGKLPRMTLKLWDTDSPATDDAEALRARIPQAPPLRAETWQVKANQR